MSPPCRVSRPHRYGDIVRGTLLEHTVDTAVDTAPPVVQDKLV